ncbi:hypothetical protein FGE12_07590 [Aggregicoccus sp. 17bor-14]|uniref:hypothetical protein n=1 Tax=Myxococcaceae TaxID=31 RepID=UPI00129CB334|nr:MULTISPECIES: hypothetical protein [Myxococcaceae]MBF5042256.1 hypothetical protein [Simulacricoccus sp. 17bor-14]MRI88031.1 hypothetical protein [Aggregicoccus sp. 17bor-14]
MSDANPAQTALPSNWMKPPEAAPRWPLGAPPPELALQLLRGEVAAPAAAATVVRQLRSALTAIDEDALRGDALSFDPAPLRAALGTQLRLALALEHTARAGVPEPEALNVLLAQVDGALDPLRGYEGKATPEVLARVSAVRDALVRDAVALSEVRVKGVPAAQPAAQPAGFASKSNAAAAQGAGKVVLFSRADGARQRKQKVALAVLGAVLITGAGLQLWEMRGSGAPPYQSVPGAPAGLGLLQTEGARRIVRTQDGRAPSPELRAWLHAQEQQGLRVVPMSPSTFLLEPAPVGAAH